MINSDGPKLEMIDHQRPNSRGFVRKTKWPHAPNVFRAWNGFVQNVRATRTIMMKQQSADYLNILVSLKNDFEKRFRKRGAEEAKMDDFQSYRTLGMGSFGRVLLVRHKNKNTFYAMKVLEKCKIIKYKQLEHTLYEKRLLHALRYPFIVYLEYAFQDNSYIYLCMPFINGGEMFTHLRRMKKYDEDLSKFYAAQVCLGLEYMHFLDLIYRDLKPENIMIDCRGYLKITDLGFCKMVKGRTWTLCGTPEYLAPEIILSKGYGRSVDWWSYGVLLYEMSAGFPPFSARDPMKIYEKIVAGKYNMVQHFSEELKDLIRNILQIDLSRRYGNLRDGVQDIKQHRWFKEINWMSIYEQKVDPPFVPKCKGVGDASNFDVYEEEPLVVGAVDKYAKEFADF